MKRVRQAAGTGGSLDVDKYGFSLHFGPVEGVGDDFQCLRCVLIELPSRRILGTRDVTALQQTTRSLDRARSFPRGSAAHEYYSKPLEFTIGLEPAQHATIPTLHAPKLVELELKGKRHKSLHIASLLESWTSLAKFDLDVSLFSKADGQNTIDLPLINMGHEGASSEGTIKLPVHLTSFPLQPSVPQPSLPANIANTTLSTINTLPEGMHTQLVRTTSGHARMLLSSSAPVSPKHEEPHPVPVSHMIQMLSHRGGGLPGLTTEAATQAVALGPSLDSASAPIGSSSMARLAGNQQAMGANMLQKLRATTSAEPAVQHISSPAASSIASTQVAEASSLKEQAKQRATYAEHPAGTGSEGISEIRQQDVGAQVPRDDMPGIVQPTTAPATRTAGTSAFSTQAGRRRRSREATTLPDLTKLNALLQKAAMARGNADSPGGFSPLSTADSLDRVPSPRRAASSSVPMTPYPSMADTYFNVDNVHEGMGVPATIPERADTSGSAVRSHGLAAAFAWPVQANPLPMGPG